jgi:hypothetical protein
MNTHEDVVAAFVNGLIKGLLLIWLLKQLL